MELYPELKPETLEALSRFTFNLESLEHTAEDLDLQLEAWDTKISRLIEKYQITCGGHQFPVIAKILELTHDEEELVGVAKALERVAHHIQVLDRLEKQKAVIEYAQQDSDWFAWAFGDFNDDIEDIEAELKALSESTSSED